jgi:hypothetical protein
MVEVLCDAVPMAKLLMQKIALSTFAPKILKHQHHDRCHGQAEVVADGVDTSEVQSKMMIMGH